MICGSSSRGSFHTAKAPEQQGADDHQRRQLRADPGAGELSREAERVICLHWRTSALAYR